MAGLAPFREPSFRRQFPADLAVSWAFEMEGLALGWYILTETGSVLWLTVFASVQYLGTLVAPIFGVWGDRVGLRRMLASMRGFYAVQAAVIAAMAMTGTIGPWQVLAVSALMGLVRPSDLGMRSGQIAATMPPALMTQAMGLARCSADSARVAGALAGAGLVATFGLGPAYLVIVALYVFGGLRSWMGEAPARLPVAVERRSMWRDLWDGFGHAAHRPALLACLLLAFLVNMLAMPVTGGLLPYVAREVHGLERSGLGAMVACFAAGAVFGSTMMIVRGAALRPGRAMLVSGLAWFPLLVVFALTPDLRWAMALLAVIGCNQSISMVAMSVILLRCTEDRFRGRVMGLRMLAVYGLPIGLLLSGPAIEWCGIVRMSLIYAGVGLACTLAISLRWWRHLWPLEAEANARRI